MPKEKDKKPNNRGRKKKYIGIVAKTFVKKDTTHNKGDKYDALCEDSYNYLIKVGYLKPA